MKLGLRTLLCALTLAGASCGEVAAPAREISLTPVLRLTGLVDSLDLAPRAPEISSRGFIVVHTLDAPRGGLALFDSTGRYLRRIGAPGQGPGEFGRVEGVGFGAGDSLWVVDGLRRLQIFTPPPEVHHVRTVQTERFFGGGEVTPYGLLSAAVWTSEGIHPPTLFDSEGAVKQRYGASRDWSDDTSAPVRVPVLRDSVSVWAAMFSGYALELLSADGSVLQHLAPEHPWFPPGMPRVRSMTAPPPPAIRDLSVDSTGHLWILLRRPTAAWTPPALPSGGPWTPQELARAMPNPHANFEGLLEALDPQTDRILSSFPVTAGSLGFVGRDLLWELEQDDDGFVTIILHRIALR